MKTILSILVLSLLSACGGGGDDTPETIQSDPYICKSSDYHFYTELKGWQCMRGSY